MKAAWITAFSIAGLFTAAGAWALHQQADYIFASLACGATAYMWGVTGLCLIMLIAGSLASIPMINDRVGFDIAPGGQPRRFLATVSVLAAALFLFALFLQAGAMLFLPPCVA